MVTIKVMT